MRNLQNKLHKNRIIVIIIIITIIALIHLFRVGQYLNGDLYKYYYSYASDIMIPFAFYFLLCLEEPYIKFFQKWYKKAILIFVGASMIEILQRYGIYVVGETYDILDILMFAIGVSLSVFLDKLVFKYLIPFWDSSES
jgi:hypothetical protein